VFIAAPAPQHQEPPDSTEHTRVAILAAAHECLTERGIRRTSVEEVARRAGVARGTVYLHFSDKSTLINAVLLRNGEAVRDQLAAQLAGVTSLADQLDLAARFSVSPQRGELLVTLREREPETLALMLLTDSRSWIEQSARFWAPRLRTAHERGQLHSGVDVDAAAEWIARMLYTIATAPSERVDPASRSAQQIGEYVSQFLLFGLRCTP
jgi:AcrR family transcriptional regulator